MNARTLIRPFADKAVVLADAIDTGKDALSRRLPSESDHLKAWRSSAAKCAGSSVLSAVFGGLAVWALAHMFEASKKHQLWKKDDRRLDAALEDSSFASDPVARY